MTASREWRVVPISSLAIVLIPALASGQGTTRVSVDASGVEGNGDSSSGVISPDARFVAFGSYATNLVAGDINWASDVFVRDRSTGTVERVSVESSGVQGNGDSWVGGISADGRIVAFNSYAWNLDIADFNGAADVFVHDRSTGVTERISVDSSGVAGNSESYVGAISADGQVVAFTSYADNLVAGDTNGTWDVFVHDRTTGVTERVSVDSSGVEGVSDSWAGAISGDGRVVLFQSYSDHLVAGDTNGDWDVFVHDRTTGITERVSVASSGVEGDSASYVGAISADGQRVAFTSYATNLAAGDVNGAADVFVRDRSAGTTERVSVDSSGAPANGDAWASAISADGAIVVFQSYADDLVAGDANGATDAFVHECATGITERISVDSSGIEGNGESYASAISANGDVVAFFGYSDNLVAGDANQAMDVFLHERCPTGASWSSYGSGFPGTNGVPSFTARANPVLGKTLTLDLANSSGRYTFGLLFVGLQQATIHSNWGGDLLVVPLVTTVLGLAPGGATVVGDVPSGDGLCGLVVDLQAIEGDAGAAKGVSFTPGLELRLGR